MKAVIYLESAKYNIKTVEKKMMRFKITVFT